MLLIVCTLDHGTMDDSTIEQFSLTLQYVDETMEIHSDFLGFL